MNIQMIYFVVFIEHVQCIFIVNVRLKCHSRPILPLLSHWEARLWKCYFIAWNRTNENERYKNISNQNYIQQMNELLMKAYSPPHNVRLGGWSHQMIAEWKSIRNHHIQATFRGDHSSWPMRTNNRTKSSQLITLISSSVETCALNIT